MQKRGQPVVSIDTKKKELVGDFKNPGQEWRPEDDPQEVRVHDFKDKDLGKAIPHGVYDLTHNQGWVSVASIMTLPNSLPTASGNGGRKWANGGFREPAN